jgi:hypothetical protein
MIFLVTLNVHVLNYTTVEKTIKSFKILIRFGSKKNKTKLLFSIINNVAVKYFNTVQQGFILLCSNRIFFFSQNFFNRVTSKVKKEKKNSYIVYSP